jgi:parallel beta-helix repeat protein
VYAYSADGSTNCTGSPKTCTPLWTATTGAAVTSSPAITNGVVYVGSNDGKLYAFDFAGTKNCSAGTCTPLWTATTGGAVSSSPAIAYDTVFVGSADAKLYAFDALGSANCVAATCAPLWTATTGGPITSSPSVANKLVFVGSSDGKLTAYDTDGTNGCSGAPVVCTPLVTDTTGGPIASSPAIADAVVFVGSNDAKLHAFQLPAASTTTAVTSSLSPSTAGTAVTFTATVASGSATPTGSVTFKDGSATLATVALTNGQAAYTTAALGTGSHSITAAFAGNHQYASSTSPVLTQVVNPGGTVLYVDRNNPSCSNGGAGSASVPFCTISAGAQRATAGTTVQVASGTYNEQVTVVSSGTSSNPVTFTAAPAATVTVTGAAHGFVVSGRTWVTIRGFTVSGTSDHGIELTSSSHLTIDRNRVTLAGTPSDGLTKFGIHASGLTQSAITNNTADHNSDAGIRIVSNSNDNSISGNETFANARQYTRAAAGIDVRDSTGNLVFRNVSHDNEDSGINAWTGTANGQNTFFDNVTYRNGDHGIDVHNAVDAHVIANTVYGNVDSGIESTTSTRTYLANNVSVDNGINSPRTSGNIRIDAGSVGTAVLNDDLVFLRTSGVMIDWNGVKYSSLAAFRTATGQESRGTQADPKFRNAAANDFHLLAGSPAIDSANSGASGQPTTDFDGFARVDDPATPNTGIGSIAYADRGAFEFQP